MRNDSADGRTVGAHPEAFSGGAYSRWALRFATLFKQSDDAIDSDDVYSDLKKHFSEEEIIELALLCGETDGVGKFARSLRMRTWEEACSIQPLLRAKTAPVSVQAAE
jgi:hypothetical protein